MGILVTGVPPMGGQAGKFLGTDGVSPIWQAGALNYKGAIDCSANPNYPAAAVGDTYAVSVAGKIGGASGKPVAGGDLIIAVVANGGGTQAAVGADWDLIESAFDAQYSNATPTLVTLGGINAGSTFASQSMTQMWNALLYPYIAPLISLAASVGAGVFEFGDTHNAITLTPTLTTKSDPITAVVFKRQDNGGGFSTIQSQGGVATPYSNNPNTNIGNASAVSQVAVTQFEATATDGVTTPVSNILTYNYVYPFYYGSGAQGLTGSQVAALTKLVAQVGNKVEAFTPSSQVYYFAYPAAYGNLTQILDGNGFDITADWTLHNPVSITGLDGSPQNYKVYEYNNINSVSQSLTFKF